MNKWILLLGLSVSGLAIADAPPMHCPNVVNIQSVGLSNNLVQDNNAHWWAGRAKQLYGTPQQWTFVIGDIVAPTKAKARLEAAEALVSLSYNSGPIAAPANKWLCLYDNDEGFPSGAVTPPINMLGPLYQHE